MTVVETVATDVMMLKHVANEKPSWPKMLYVRVLVATKILRCASHGKLRRE